MLVAAVSAITGKPVDGSTAVTGEISVQGRVCPVGGVPMKVEAAVDWREALRRMARHELLLIPWEEARGTRMKDVFARRPDGAYDRIEERQVQRAHTRRELRAWLSEAGFQDVSFYGRQRMTAPRTGDDRWHVTAKKP